MIQFLSRRCIVGTISTLLLVGFTSTQNAFALQGETTLESKNSSDEKLNWYKGNLHTHSLWSDGDDFPEMITKWYVDHDYQFLAMTDHNILSEGQKWMPLKSIESRGGENVVSKYRKTFGDGWVETKKIETEAAKPEGNKPDADEKVQPKVETQVRLKTLSEYRSKFEKPETFLLLTGEEISDQVNGFPVHMNATNVQSVLRPAGGATVAEAMTNNLRAAKEQADKTGQPILVHLNHPNFGWAVTAEDLAKVTLEKFFEIYNGHPSVNQLGDDMHPGLERLWDIANTIRIDQLKSAPLMGLATDDCHYYHGRPGSQPGRGWIVVRAKELKPAVLLEAMSRGDFYGSSGVELEDFRFDGKTLHVDIKPQEGQTFTTQFVGTRKGYDRDSKPRVVAVKKPDNLTNNKPMRLTRVYSKEIGQTFASIEGNSATYRLTGDEIYVRAIITSSADHPNPSYKNQKQQAWVQPVGWK